MTDTHGTGTFGTEQMLREALDVIADSVSAPPGAYRDARREWLRRERRRKVVLTIVIAIVFAVATLIGLWVLNDTSSRPHPVYGVAATNPRTPLAPSAHSTDDNQPLPRPTRIGDTVRA
jgi:hypothetical protein